MKLTLIASQHAALTLALSGVVVGCGVRPTPAPDADLASAAPPSANPTPSPTSTVDDATVEIQHGPIDPITQQQWVTAVREYESRSAKVSGRQARVELGQWAYEQGLEDEAWEQFGIVIKEPGTSHPDIDAYARRAMGVQDPRAGAGVGANERLVKLDRVAKIRENALAFSFTVAIEDDAPAAFFEDLQWRLRRMNWFFWRISHGQMFLDKLLLKDKSSDGRFVIEQGKLDATLLTGGGAFCANAGRKDWRVVSAGRVYTRVVSHEMLHGVFGLPDERHGCACIMQGGLYGIRSDQLGMCDDESHRTGPGNEVSCWTLAQRKYPTLKHPADQDWGAPPEPRFTVEDR